MKMEITIDNSCEPKLMSKEEIVDTLKTMVFGTQAFERFNTKERETLDKAWNLIDQYEARLKADMVTILNKIRAEITENIEFNIKMNYMGIVSGLALANDVIDKYNAEIEPQESENKE